MVSGKKDKKLTYEPPKIYQIEVDMTQAMGQTSCSRGNTATASCTRGNTAMVTCVRGNQATSHCDTGSNYVPPCVAGMGF